MSKNQKQRAGRRYLRKRGVAERYDISDRSRRSPVALGTAAAANIFAGLVDFPIWDEEALDENDRAATLRPAS